MGSADEAARWAAQVNVAAERSGATPALIAPAAVTGLAFVRSLGARGIPVFCLDHRPWEVGMVSRYSRPQALPDARTQPEAWVRFLLDAAPNLQCRPALIPCGDAQLRALVPVGEELGAAYACALPEKEVFQALADKRSQYSLLHEAGAPLPRTVLPENENEAERAARGLGLPCVVKPGLGDLWSARTGAKLELAEDPEQARSAWRSMTEAGAGALVQEWIPGADDSFFGCLAHIDAAGEVRACFTKRKLRQFPRGFGNGSYQISIEDPELAAMSLDLLARIGYRGTAAIEYKKDPRDGRLKLIEINCRAISGTQLAIDAGVDLPWIVYRDCIGQPLPPATNFAAGRTLVNFSWDVRSYLESGDRSAAGFVRWARSVLRADSDAVFRWKDLGPIVRTWSRFWRR